MKHGFTQTATPEKVVNVTKNTGFAVARTKYDIWRKILDSDKKPRCYFKLSFLMMGNSFGKHSSIETDEVFLCVDDAYNINYAKKVLTELNNEGIFLLEETPELNCSDNFIHGEPMWLHICEKYNNHLLIDVTTLRFCGAIHMDANIDDMRCYPQISFVLMQPEDSDKVVGELRAELAKKLNVDTEKFVKAITPTESYRTDKRTRIYVSQWQANCSNSPQFGLSAHCNRY